MPRKKPSNLASSMLLSLKLPISERELHCLHLLARVDHIIAKVGDPVWLAPGRNELHKLIRDLREQVMDPYWVRWNKDMHAHLDAGLDALAAWDSGCKSFIDHLNFLHTLRLTQAS